MFLFSEYNNYATDCSLACSQLLGCSVIAIINYLYLFSFCLEHLSSQNDLGITICNSTTMSRWSSVIRYRLIFLLDMHTTKSKRLRAATADAPPLKFSTTTSLFDSFHPVFESDFRSV